MSTLRNSEARKTTKIRVLRDISKNPHISQREIASRNEISLGKANYIIKSLIEKGHVKLHNFKESKNKKGYMYLLTPKGIKAKAILTADYLKRKMKEYERLRRELNELKQELNKPDY
ncbi:MAG: MarR family EPS-associated transcriptional regulator [Candidatus Loosdrechtia sp.]|uniref:MarR family EPS-associated transcriptional regulator n=1 Tax=Candidatus Loosdrechtia sp. TaxID=3101272 RepID=UPI003A657245|nr:MAG: MarR family EPS-associated transcriptional regulator [Candidatus Jettenia sp. AMX2]